MSNTLCQVVQEFEVKLKSCFLFFFMFILFNYQFLCNTWIELFYSKLLRVCVVKIYNLWDEYCMNDFNGQIIHGNTAYENQQQNPANTWSWYDVIYNVELIMPICIHINKTELFSHVASVM